MTPIGNIWWSRNDGIRCSCSYRSENCRNPDKEVVLFVGDGEDDDPTKSGDLNIYKVPIKGDEIYAP